MYLHGFGEGLKVLKRHVRAQNSATLSLVEHSLTMYSGSLRHYATRVADGFSATPYIHNFLWVKKTTRLP